MDKQIYNQIARIPLPIVAGAYNKYNSSPVAGVTKTQACEWLTEVVERGHLTIQDIQQCAPSSFNAPSAPAVNLAPIEQAIQGLETRLTSQGSSIGSLGHLLSKLDTKIGTLDSRIDDIKLDPVALQIAVSAAIADEFAPFKQAVKDASAEQVIADMTANRIIDSRPDVFGIEVSNVRGKPLSFSVWDCPTAPAIDPDFIWSADILRHLWMTDTFGENVWFGGEKGTGKSETARQFAARTGRPFKRINFHKHTSAEEYLGATGLVDGATEFQARDFLTAYTTAGCVILLDEVTNADAGELAPLNGLLEPNAQVAYGGKVWRKAQGVIIIAADNTFGSGDDTGRYVGTRTQNVALIDRFSRIIPFDFLPDDKEIEAIASRANCSTDLAAHVHASIKLARQKVTSGDIVDAPSIRSAIAFCRAVQVIDPKSAWETTIVARQPSESAATLRMVFESCINPDTISKNI